MIGYNDDEIMEQISQCISLLKDELGQDLLGGYMLGSLIAGGPQEYKPFKNISIL